ncbi:MAG TPA: hypothetical protein PLU30_26345 [Verrucomicrobiae bacterium]|nr:hypothetical protein [Verrucomicrobiae bacterium]
MQRKRPILAVALAAAAPLISPPAPVRAALHSIPAAVHGNGWTSIQLGLGFDSGTGELMQMADQLRTHVADPANTTNLPSSGLEIHAYLRNSRSDWSRGLETDLLGQYQVNGVLNASFGASYSDWRRLTQARQTVEILITYQTGSTRLTLPTLKAGDGLDFLARNGDEIVTEIREGAVASIRIEIDSSESQEATTVAGKLTLDSRLTKDQLSARVTEAVAAITSNSSLVLDVAIRPAMLSVPAPKSLGELMQFVDQFVEAATKSPAPIAFQTTPATSWFSDDFWYAPHRQWKKSCSLMLNARLALDATMPRFLALDNFFVSQCGEAGEERRKPLVKQIITMRRADHALREMEQETKQFRTDFRIAAARTEFTNSIASVYNMEISDGTESVKVGELTVALRENGRLFGYTVEEKTSPGNSMTVTHRAHMNSPNSPLGGVHSFLDNGRFWYDAIPCRGLVFHYGLQLRKGGDPVQFWTDPIEGEIVIEPCEHWLYCPTLTGARRTSQPGYMPLVQGSNVSWNEGSPPPPGMTSVGLAGSTGGGNATLGITANTNPTKYYVVRKSTIGPPTGSAVGGQ